MVLKLQELVDIKCGCIADDIPREILAEAVGSDNRQLVQRLRRAVEIGALGIWMNRLERVGHRLNLANTPGGVLQPARWDELLMEISMFRIVGCKPFQLAIKPFLEEPFDQQAKFGRPTRDGTGHREPFYKAAVLRAIKCPEATSPSGRG